MSLLRRFLRLYGLPVQGSRSTGGSQRPSWPTRPPGFPTGLFESDADARLYLLFFRVRVVVFVAAPVCLLGAMIGELRVAFGMAFMTLWLALAALSVLAVAVVIVRKLRRPGSLAPQLFPMWHLGEAARTLGADPAQLRRRIWREVAIAVALIVVAAPAGTAIAHALT